MMKIAWDKIYYQDDNNHLDKKFTRQKISIDFLKGFSFSLFFSLFLQSNPVTFNINIVLTMAEEKKKLMVPAGGCSNISLSSLSYVVLRPCCKWIFPKILPLWYLNPRTEVQYGINGDRCRLSGPSSWASHQSDWYSLVQYINNKP